MKKGYVDLTKRLDIEKYRGTLKRNTDSQECDTGRQMNDDETFNKQQPEPGESPSERGQKTAPRGRIPAFLFDRSVSPGVGSAIEKLVAKRREKRGW
ncbi:hypothetical protein VQ042_06525 [Aurantimonas sp. A2-1-M11]|uniref:hypothetical protein n=1 Tax=Aurantimonas sp. A2-1-M11 TaxID=3113712 RepID=UPI002F92B1D1